MIMWAAIDCMLIELCKCCMTLQQIVNADAVASFISSRVWANYPKWKWIDCPYSAENFQDLRERVLGQRAKFRSP